ncbi:UBX domain-containing protein 7 [Mytilus coruscus]|uniref:UBX domain-containing protein 7 n=1 Tax=Mytilus coruscus TaxID=42192 RepID=A0A6J8E3G0_MYTCO|nr:UBX domain-containing protein 7 [Mytilus coruscus]
MATNVDNAILEQFCSITGATNEVGVRLLEACNCNLDMAIGMHMDSNADGVVTENDQPSTSDYGNDGDEVRAPIPQRSETLVEEMPIYGFRGRRRKARSVFDGFRDFQAEAKQQEEMLTSGNVPSVPNKKRTLEDLFRPPIDITFKGTFASLRDEGKTKNKWLLVNVQNVQEFVCQALNRDVWSNRNAKAVIKDNFIFWQTNFLSLNQLREPDINYLLTPSPKLPLNFSTCNSNLAISDTMEKLANCRKFGGYPHENAALFIAEFESYATLHNISPLDDNRIIAALHLHLTGPALTWFNSLSSENKASWEAIVHLFNDKYVDLDWQNPTVMLDSEIFEKHVFIVRPVN